MIEIANQDIVSLCRFCDRFIIELIKSTSSSISDWRLADIDRLFEYRDILKKRKDVIYNEPELDCPETNRRVYPTPEAPLIPDMENDSVRDVCELLLMIREELVYCQSARIPNGLSDADAIRFDTFMLKLDNYCDQFLAEVEPIDVPATAPKAPLT
jgi:hypothetical protein